MRRQFLAMCLGDMKVSDYVQRAADFARAFGTLQIGKFDDYPHCRFALFICAISGLELLVRFFFFILYPFPLFYWLIIATTFTNLAVSPFNSREALITNISLN